MIHITYPLPLVIILMICHSFITYGQDDRNNANEHYYNHRHQVGINFTNVLGNVLSLNPNNTNSPYGLTYRRHGKKWTFRSGVGVGYFKTTTFSTIGNVFGDVELTELNVESFIGFEKSLSVSSNFRVGVGMDIIGSVLQEDAKLKSIDSFENYENAYSAGLGPFIRFEYKIASQITLSTESSLYGRLIFKETYLKDGPLEVKNSFTDSGIELVMPEALFINISF